MANLWGALGMYAPCKANFFNFHAIFDKVGQIVGWRPPCLELVPLRLGTPGSATADLLSFRVRIIITIYDPDPLVVILILFTPDKDLD